MILLGTFILAFCSYTPTSDLLINSLKKQYPPYKHDDTLKSDQLPKLVIVLSGGHIAKPSLPVQSRLGYETLIRLIEGIRIYRALPDGKLFLSGGAPEGSISSAQEMARLAIELGAKEEDIIIETKSANTEEQAQIIKSMVGDEPFILVTSAFHMPRTMALFLKLGMRPVPAPTQNIEERILVSGPKPLFPYLINLEKSEIAFHEYLGIVWARITNQI